MKKMLGVLCVITLLALLLPLIEPLNMEQDRKETPKVGVLMVGTRDDSSWNELPV